MSPLWKLLLSTLLVGTKSVAIAEGVQPVINPQITTTRAMDIATHFGQQIGHSMRIPPASLVGSSASAQLSVSQGRSRWKATLFDGKCLIDIDIDAMTGVVLRYFVRSDNPGLSVTGNPIPKEQAITQATSYLTSAGAMRSNELILKSAEIMHINASSATWLVSWDREFNGIPYRNQGAHVTVDAETGELIGFGVNFPTPAPTSSASNITQQQAEDIAAKLLADAGLQQSVPVRLQTEIVQPNTFWQPNGSESQTLPYARVVWMCQYVIDSHSYEVWVDRETGQVIGGSQASNMGFNTRSKAKPTSRKVKMTAPKAKASK